MPSPDRKAAEVAFHFSTCPFAMSFQAGWSRFESFAYVPNRNIWSTGISRSEPLRSPSRCLSSEALCPGGDPTRVPQSSAARSAFSRGLHAQLRPIQLSQRGPASTPQYSDGFHQNDTRRRDLSGTPPKGLYFKLLTHTQRVPSPIHPPKVQRQQGFWGFRDFLKMDFEPISQRDTPAMLVDTDQLKC